MLECDDCGVMVVTSMRGGLCVECWRTYRRVDPAGAAAVPVTVEGG